MNLPLVSSDYRATVRCLKLEYLESQAVGLRLLLDLSRCEFRNSVTGEHCHKDFRLRKENGIKISSECGLAIIALSVLTGAGFARYQYRCATIEVVITSAPGRESSIRLEEHLTFWIDDAAKTVALSDGTQLQVTRFDPSWISAHHGDMEYEFNRADGTLTFAGSTTEGNTTTTHVGSGRCELLANELE